MRTAGFVIVVLMVTALFVKRGLARSYNDHEYTGTRVAMIGAHGARQVHIQSAAGDLRVVGVDGGDEVRVRGTARGSSERVLERIKVELRRDGDGITVRSVLPRESKNWLGRMSRQALDMIVEVPVAMEADVTDGSGNLEVQGVSALRVTDGAGELRVVDVRGPVQLTDGSGEVEVLGVHGDLLITDGSGELNVRDVMGSLVATDGSGSMTLSGVKGDVLVKVDGSGDIDVADVAGRLIVQQDGSGAVRYRDVKGAVELPAKKNKEHARHE